MSAFVRHESRSRRKRAKREERRRGEEEEVMTEEQVELTREPRNGWCWVTFEGASPLHALSFAERRGE